VEGQGTEESLCEDENSDWRAFQQRRRDNSCDSEGILWWIDSLAVGLWLCHGLSDVNLHARLAQNNDILIFVSRFLRSRARNFQIPQQPIESRIAHEFASTTSMTTIISSK
jgi:hypothetical protein